MENELNKKLCELLEIKPKKDCICIKGFNGPETCLVNKNCSGCQYNASNEYPDFTRPENFVKLLELCRTWDSGLDFSFENDFESEHMTLQEVFLKWFLPDYFEKDHGGIGEHERFKKLLRETNWEY